MEELSVKRVNRKAHCDCVSESLFNADVPQKVAIKAMSSAAHCHDRSPRSTFTENLHSSRKTRCHPSSRLRLFKSSSPFEQYIINSKQQTLFIWPLDSSPDLLFAIWLDACEWSFDRIGKSRKETVRDMGIAQKGGYWDTGACGLSSSLTEGSV